MNWEKRFVKFIGSRLSVYLHTVFFIFMFFLRFLGVDLDTILLVLTTIVSLEAIYLAIFIQMSVNENTKSLMEVEEDIEDIQEDMGEIQEDVGEIQQDVDEIQHDVDEIESDIDVIQTDVSQDKKEETDLDNIKIMLEKLIEEVDRMKNNK
jgi:peptidoglycan hydrolase CwlO-like protein